ncbi:hypothetical protein BOTBODRAFT_170118 [Botryobasidium botryosum FD-172 SS1]|uniref:F-box domain-containing protein n=1 Tax=Botryobasidium botryosum (strain FD-172 SS1) TaxID=930990 RepID=A0A067N8I7_BOTB1|nr:hypothetical protein BOTBODRAFT_170118 [Botryobasidium botryosum FD-172 SS1]
MYNIRRFALHDVHLLCGFEPRVLTNISTLPALVDLELGHFSNANIATISTLRSLRRLSLTNPLYTQWSPFKLTVSNVKRLLSSNRLELEDLTLGALDLVFDLVPSSNGVAIQHGDSTERDQGIWEQWPNLCRADLRACSSINWAPNLSYTFPRVRSFSSPMHMDWATREYNRPFLSALHGLEGSLALMRFALHSGCMLRSAVIRDTIRIDSDIDLREFLPPTLQHMDVTLRMDALTFRQATFVSTIARRTNQITSLSMSIQSGPFCGSFLTTMFHILKTLSTTRLRYLSIKWNVICGDVECEYCEIDAAPQPLARIVDVLIPSVLALALDLGKDRSRRYSKSKESGHLAKASYYEVERLKESFKHATDDVAESSSL